MIPNDLRYEVQVSATGRARCKICGELIAKGDFECKIIGFRLKQSVHPDSIAKLTLVLGNALKELKPTDLYKLVVRAKQGEIKLGHYKKLEDKSIRFETLRVLNERREDNVRESAKGSKGTGQA
jgi:hypothetical protein